ncbi:MAG: hypothetical protein DME33_00795 [Verrucomicrobia bacterium]|nr:MAG: hypothetical protein DME33_00795 [Verrucomicrobiota bacterium]
MGNSNSRQSHVAVLPPRRELATNKAELNPIFMSEKIYFAVDVCKDSLATEGSAPEQHRAQTRSRLT